MSITNETALLERAISEIERLLSNYDFCGQIESALPLLRQHHHTLTTLGNALLPSGRTTDIRAYKRWVDDLVVAYQKLGGQAPDSDVYRVMKHLRQSEGRSWPRRAKAAIRRTRQAHNVESLQYRGGADLFRMLQPGHWRLKNYIV
jgi:hypothetical protein